jgi:hypothetical protein
VVRPGEKSNTGILVDAARTDGAGGRAPCFVVASMSGHGLKRATCILAVAASAISCGHGRLVPAPTAQLAAEAAPVGTDAGVRLVANLDDWRGLADRLPDELTPIKIRIVNRGDEPVSILYQALTLRGHKGRVYHAVPAIPLDHARLLERTGPIRPVFAASSFDVAARYRDAYPDLRVWPRHLKRDDSYYERAYERWSGHPPGRELCRMALPEGVLEPGGEITGYVYFENPTSSESALALTAHLASGRDDRPVASIKIPLRVE